MQTHHFPCPFCGRKMGVGVELLGRKVRCPHCKQVVLAPTAPAAPAAAAAVPAAAMPLPPPPAAPPAPTPPVPDDLPVFNLPKREAAESIFGETAEEGDDLFGSSDATRLAVPELPPPEPFPTAVVPVQIVTPDPTPQPPAVPGTDPCVDLAAPEPAPPRPAAPPPPPVPIPSPPLPAPAAAANPWASFDVVPAAPLAPTLAPAAVAAPELDGEHEPSRPDRPAAGRLRPGAPAPGGGTALKVGFFVVLAYAVVVTGLAVYGLFVKSGAPAGHPLSAIPDDFGEFKPAERKKTGKLTIPVDGELPPELRVALGEKLAIGSLEVTPTKVEARRLIRVGEYASGGGKETLPPTPPALVLTMRIRNTSDDLFIHPTDPAFNRKVTTPAERVGTGLVVGNQTFWGGAIDWPFRKQVTRLYEAAQAADATPLNPGETRDYVVFTDTKLEILRAVRNATDGLVWRVQVRRGRIEFEGKDIPVTAIIGVDFQPGDVRGLD